MIGDTPLSGRPDETRLQRNALGVPGILFFVVAAAAPLTVVVGVPPLVFGLAENVASPAGFVVAGLVLLVFSVGYAAMSRHISGPAGFAVYVEQAFGRDLGGAAASVAVLSYYGFLLGLYGFFGYLAEPQFEKIGIGLPWWAWAFAAIAVAGLLGYRNVNLSARVLGVLLVAEVLIVLALDVAIVVRGGDAGLSAAGFSPATLLAHAPGIVLLFAFSSFVGFEATTLYGEEARDRHRTVPRSTYAAVLIITGFYVLTFWALGVGYGDKVVAAAQDSPGTFVFDLAHRYASGMAAETMNWLVLSSVFAALLAFHNAFARYAFAMGRAGLLPDGLGRAHAKHRSPHIASITTTTVAALTIAVFALAGGHPYTHLYAWFIGVGTIGILLLYTACSVSVLAFLRRGGRDSRLWQSLVAPILATIGLALATFLGIDNFNVLTGSTNALINLLWILPFVAAVLGYAVARRRYRGRTGHPKAPARSG